jgi:hypothetical protein
MSTPGTVTVSANAVSEDGETYIAGARDPGLPNGVRGVRMSSRVGVYETCLSLFFYLILRSLSFFLSVSSGVTIHPAFELRSR